MCPCGVRKSHTGCIRQLQPVGAPLNPAPTENRLNSGGFIECLMSLQRAGDSQSGSTRNVRNLPLDAENQEFFPEENGSSQEEVQVTTSSQASVVPASSSATRCTETNRFGRTTSTKRRRTTEESGGEASAEESQVSYFEAPAKKINR